MRGYAVNISCAVIAISPATLPNGQAGIGYSQTVSASGGTAPYNYTVTAGSLPPGLSLNASTGVLSGTPVTPGAYNFTITATDANTCSGMRGYAVSISCPVITLTPAVLPDGQAGVAYSQAVSASGGTAPYSYAVTAGALPPGLLLNPTTGVISGTSTSPESYSFAITATDANACSGSRAYALDINCPVITLSPATLPEGQVDVAYSQTPSASGGTAPYTYAITGGTLPGGLILNSVTGEISGTPNATGNFPFEITATDANVCEGTRSYAIVVTPAPCLFCDDFEDETLDPNWLYVKPSWIESGGFMRGTSARKAIAIAQPFAGCRLCTVDAAMQVASGVGNNIWLLAWYVDKRNTMELLAKEPNDRWILKQRVNGTIVTKGKAVKIMNPNTVYNVRLSFDGTVFRVFVDDMATPLFVVTSRATVPTGTIGFQAKNTTGSFGYIHIH